MKKVVLVMGWRRPEYLRQCLAALSNCRGLCNYDLQISIDGPRTSSDQQNCLNVVCSAMPSLLFASSNVSIETNSDNLGIDLHNASAYELAFDDPEIDFLVAVEDDAILSADALELADWYYSMPSRDEYLALSLGHNTKVLGDPGLVDEYAGIDTSWAYCFTRGAWEKFRLWWNCKKVPPTGWDYSLAYAMWRNHWKGLVPHLSRVLNVGREGGVHAYPSWYDANIVGLVASDGKYEGKYGVAGKLPPYWWIELPEWARSEES